MNQNTLWDPTNTELLSEKGQIRMDTIDKLEIKVAEIIAVEKIENTDKLLQLRVDAGDPQHRQIVSGLAIDYPNFEELIGTKIMIFSNLRPQKLRGYISQGMLLAAKKPDGLELITISREISNGTIVG
ncbi:hypothetical protein [Brevibacillus laterosporus]|uniref:hypothetical protein n=1 Tax=Brevibacillus laterosporus TaxID=1465 RepID=UPI00159641B3|nr:hypothetical protein [Brevibacillus laterosporus]